MIIFEGVLRAKIYLRERDYEQRMQNDTYKAMFSLFEEGAAAILSAIWKSILLTAYLANFVFQLALVCKI